jgi:phosphoglycerate dehydrogenase-like enzyme
MSPIVLALDTLIDDSDVEESTAAVRGWRFERWDGSEEALATAPVVVHVTTRIDEELIGRLGRCKVIGRFGTGLDTVDLEAARRAGMAVVGVREYCTPELTAHTVALALALLRLKGRSEVVGHVPGWSEFRRRNPLRGELTALVVGYGAVGSSVATALRALHMTTIVATRHGAEAASRSGATVLPLLEGLQVSDLILFHLDLSDGTRGAFGTEALGLVRPGAIVINTARLGLTDEQTLAIGIEQQVLGGIGIDARLSAESPLWRVADRDNVLITPHIGWYSEDSLARLRRAAIANSIAACEQAFDQARGQLAAKED